MFENYIEHHSKAKELCSSFIDTLQEINLEGEEFSPEIYTITSIKLTKHNCNSISVLLKEKEYGSTLMVCRNIFETFINLNWAANDDRKMFKENIFRLSGDPYFNFEKDLREMEDQKNPNPSWGPEVVAKIKKIIEDQKAYRPYLLTKNKKGNIVFKTSPPFKIKMGELKIKHHHIYSFTSIFTHPTPTLNQLFLSDNSTDEVLKSIEQMLTYCLFDIQGIVGFGLITFRNLIDNESRKRIYFELEQIYKKVQGAIQ